MADLATPDRPRVEVEPAGWQQAVDRLAAGSLTLLGLWGEPGGVLMAVLDGREGAILSLACPDKRYPSVGAHHPAAIRLERAIRDLFGLQPVGLTDLRPWLDHGRWSEEQSPATAYAFLPADG